MKIISHGSNYEIYPNELRTYDKLPAATYVVRFNPMSGFSLERIEDFENMEDKIYGAHAQKIIKVKKAFQSMERSLGVILSGDKGIGKSLFTQLFSEEVIKELDMPVILVNRAFPGIADYIESIDQESLILFDEFEKVFDSRKEGTESQDSLLGLFDGSSQRKRIYMITINNMHQVNEFMINRPGRFHYHFRFDYPDSTEIITYLKDKVPVEYHAQIESVVKFGRRVKLNYDCLRAISFELSMGTSFGDAILDLNILNIAEQKFNIEVQFEKEPTIRLTNFGMDLFKEQDYFAYYENGEEVSIFFNPKDLITDLDNLRLPVDKIEEARFDSDNEIYIEDKSVITSITLIQAKTKPLHFSSF